MRITYLQDTDTLHIEFRACVALRDPFAREIGKPRVARPRLRPLRLNPRAPDLRF